MSMKRLLSFMLGVAQSDPERFWAQPMKRYP